MIEHMVSGIKRLTLVDHGFNDTDRVYHPDVLSQFRLGTIDM